MKDDALAWIALNLIAGIGPVISHRLKETFGTLFTVFNAPREQLTAIKGINSELADRIINQDWQQAAEDELKTCRKLDCRVLTLADEEYPECLRTICFPPPVIYLRGTWQALDQQALAVVGSRQPSFYGLSATRSIVKGLVQNGFTIVSGLALGIDAEAHRTALAAGGRTLAVLAHGLDRIYPRENKRLHDEVILQGAIISEFPVSTPPITINFPRRNRLISGLSKGVFVVEAGNTSGALITARWANEQGREVFALPGGYNARLSQGTHALIQDGAKLVTNVQDIIEEILPDRVEQPKAEKEYHLKFNLESLTPGQNAVFAALEMGEQHINQVAITCQKSIPKIMSALLLLEIKGLVQALPGQIYQRVTD